MGMSLIQSKLTNINKHSKLINGVNFTHILFILAIEKIAKSKTNIKHAFIRKIVTVNG
ncbi:hypothetical protein GCM10007963_13500 [Lutibacter litoralis]|nr:hypothetical protein GCM10007963_13500 [Lutibacter litoralis]